MIEFKLLARVCTTHFCPIVNFDQSIAGKLGRYKIFHNDSDTIRYDTELIT